MSKPACIVGEGIPSPEEKLPADSEVREVFGFDKGLVRIPVEVGLFPPCEIRTIEGNAETETVTDEWGGTRKINKDTISMPQFLTFPISDREDFEKIKERYNPDDKGRFPKNWPKLVEEYRTRDYPLIMGGHPHGLFGTPRYLMGFEKLLFTFYDDPRLMKDILSFLVNFWITMWSKVLSQVKADAVLIWEDMCYNNGPMISPQLFREFLMPNYKRLISFFKDNGVEIVMVDTDGQCTELIPLFLECGVTAMYPFEVQAGMDIVQVRKEFPKLAMFGGLSKSRIANGKKEIDNELEAKLPFMLKQGGYVPEADHIIPPDVSWENFKYYRERLAQMVWKYGHL